MTDVVVVTGIGGMGLACARRLGAGTHLIVADVDEAKLRSVVAELTADGFTVTGTRVDVSDRSSVDELVAVAREIGPLRTLVHTAGLSPTMAAPARVLEVDMLGTEHVLNAFLDLARDGSVAVCIASIAGWMATLPTEVERAVRIASTHGLMEALAGVDLSFDTYTVAKRVNHIRVEQAAISWGVRGGRVVSVSPGIILTPMARFELTEGGTEQMQEMLGLSPMPRVGTAEDIAGAVQWLASPAASFITGCDLRVDGGVIAAIRALVDTS